MTVLQRDTFSYGFIVVFSGALLLWGIPAFTPEYPGYGVPASLVPNVAAGFMLLLALLGLIRTFLARRKEETASTGKLIFWQHLARFLVPCFLLMPAMSFLGFLPAGIGFLFLIQVFCGQRKPIPLILVSILPVLTVWLLMRYGLGVPMP